MFIPESRVVKFWQFSTTATTSFHTKKIPSIWPKTFLILYPSLENSTTHITIKEGEWNESGTKLEISVKLTDPEDPPILKVSFLLTIF